MTATLITPVYYLLEDGSGYYILEDGSGRYMRTEDGLTVSLTFQTTHAVERSEAWQFQPPTSST